MQRKLLIAGLLFALPLFPTARVAGGDLAGDATARPLADEADTTVDLGKLSEDFPLTIKVPEGAEAKVDLGDIAVKKGDTFRLQITTSKADIPALKKDITSNTLNKLKKFHVETDDVLLYETDVFGNAEFHFVANVKVGEKTYHCEDEKGPRFSKEDVEKMLKAAKSLEAKK